MNIDKGLKHLKKEDEKMGRLIAEFEKPEFKKDSNYFEALVRAITYQQLSGKAANTIYERFVNIIPKTVTITPKEVLKLNKNELRKTD